MPPPQFYPAGARAMDCGWQQESLPLASRHHKTFNGQTNSISWTIAISPLVGHCNPPSSMTSDGPQRLPSPLHSSLPGHLGRSSVLNDIKQSTTKIQPSNVRPSQSVSSVQRQLASPHLIRPITTPCSPIHTSYWQLHHLKYEGKISSNPLLSWLKGFRYSKANSRCP